jgi:peptide/nickel transport system substrate-binding protein
VTNEDSLIPLTAHDSSLLQKVLLFVFPNKKKQNSEKDSTKEESEQTLPIKKTNNPIPSFKQLKYLPRLLTPRERLITKILAGIIFLNLTFLSSQFYFSHRELVPAPGGEYIEAMVGSPRFINPIIGVTSDVDKDLTKLIYSGLLKYNKQHKLIPDIASNYIISDDQKTYTFFLKTNVLWHDGEPLTADDIVFTIKTIQDPDYKSPLFVSFKGVTVEKIDNYTVKFILEEPFAPFLSILTIGILPKHIWTTIPAEQFSLAAYNIKPIGSGPFKFKSLTKNKSGEIKNYNLEVNVDYYEHRPYLKNITFKFYTDFNEAAEALRNKNVDGISYLPKKLKEEIDLDPSTNFHSLRLPQYTAVFFNQNNNEFLKSKTVRHALAYAINKEKILKQALNQEGETIKGPILPGSIGYNPDLRDYNFDKEKAQELLEKAGFKQITSEEYQKLLQEEKQKESSESPSPTSGQPSISDHNQDGQATTTPPEIFQKSYLQKGNKFLEITLTTVDQPENQKAAEIIQKAWQNIGVKVTLKIVPSPEIKDIIKERNYEALLYGIITGFDPDPYPFWHSSQNQAPGLNLAVFSNKDVDYVLEDARKTNDEKTRHDKYVHFQNILIEELPAIFLYSPTYTYVLSSKVKGFDITYITQPSDRFANIDEWYIKTKKVLRWRNP